MSFKKVVVQLASHIFSAKNKERQILNIHRIAAALRVDFCQHHPTARKLTGVTSEFRYHEDTTLKPFASEVSHKKTDLLASCLEINRTLFISKIAVNSSLYHSLFVLRQ
jgi:hypothetical protein